MSRDDEAIGGQAHLALEAARRAMAANDLDAAAAHLERCVQLADQLPPTGQTLTGRGSALYDLGEVRLTQGAYRAALEALDGAERAYCHPAVEDDVNRLLADVRLRRARVFDAVGLGVPALLDVQRAVHTYAGLSDPQRLDDDYLSLGRVLALSAPILARHAGARTALAAAQEASVRLIGLLNQRVISPDVGVLRYLGLSLEVEVTTLRALGSDDVDGPLAAVTALFGPDRAAQLRAQRVSAPQPDLRDVVSSGSGSTPRVLERRLANPPGPVVVPGFLVWPDDLVSTAVDAHRLAATLEKHPIERWAAIRDAACLFSFAAIWGRLGRVGSGTERFGEGRFAFDGTVEHTVSVLDWLVLLTDLAQVALLAGRRGEAYAGVLHADFLRALVEAEGARLPRSEAYRLRAATTTLTGLRSRFP